MPKHRKKKQKKPLKSSEETDIEKKIHEDSVSKSVREKETKEFDISKSDPFEKSIFDHYKNENHKEPVITEEYVEGSKRITRFELTGSFLNWFDLKEQKLKNKYELTKAIENQLKLNHIAKELGEKFGYELIKDAIEDDAKGDIVKGHLDSTFLNSDELIRQNVLGIALHYSRNDYKPSIMRAITKAELSSMHKQLVILDEPFSWDYEPEMLFSMFILYTPTDFDNSILFMQNYETYINDVRVTERRGVCFVDVLTNAKWDIPMILLSASPGKGRYIKNMEIEEKEVLEEQIQNKKDLLSGFEAKIQKIIEKAKDFEDSEKQVRETYTIYRKRQQAIVRKFMINDVTDFSKVAGTLDEKEINVKKSIKLFLSLGGLIGGIILILIILGIVFGNSTPT